MFRSDCAGAQSDLKKHSSLTSYFYNPSFCNEERFRHIDDTIQDGNKIHNQRLMDGY